MKATLRVCRTPMDGYCDDDAALPVVLPQRENGPLRRAILRTREWFLAEQHSAGYWVGELEGDTILESEYILLLAFLGREDSSEAKKAAQYLIDKQCPEGGWSMYPGGELEISGSVKAYFALKLTGHDPSTEYMQRARAAILAAGGADRVNSFTRFYLALLGQIDYECCPEVPPEFVLLPKWFPVNMYRISAWSRTIFVPLSIMSALRPVKEIDPRRGIRELFLSAPEDWPALRCPGQKGGTGFFSWDRFFRVVDRGIKFCQRNGILPLRRKALQAAEKWMLDRFEGSDGLGAIFPPIIWSIIALRCLGYADDSVEVQECHRQLNGLMIEEDETLRLQPCLSPVWDTAIALRAMCASGQPVDSEPIEQSVDWLLRNEIRRKGDWANTVSTEPGGWCFEYRNEFYPDLDDTAMVLLALRTQLEQTGIEGSTEILPPEISVFSQQTATSPQDAKAKIIRLDRVVSSSQRAIAWMLAMQNKDGGWGAFDRDNDMEVLCHVPFADHNAMIDPSTPDLTARVLEALGDWGYTSAHSAVTKGLAYLRATQQADGSWYGRWGVNYIYGTWQVLVGLARIGVPNDDPMVVAGVNWLLAHQQPCGGWGESADSYANPALRGQGTPTASQTAWALLGLIAAGQSKHSAVSRGAQFLIEKQQSDGTWDEPEFTGTGFPQVFYLRYHMYPMYFPLLALSQWATAGGSCAEESQGSDMTASLKIAFEHELASAEA